MLAPGTFGIAFWGFLAFYGLALYAVAPSARTVEGFFRGRDGLGRPTSRWMLTSSIFIAWIFAKSVTNAANLGTAYGVVGGLAYESRGTILSGRLSVSRPPSAATPRPSC